MSNSFNFQGILSVNKTNRPPTLKVLLPALVLFATIIKLNVISKF